MKLPHSIRTVFLCLAAFLFQTDSFMDSASTVPPGACLYAFDSTTGCAYQSAGARSVYTACGVISESSASDGFEMESSETLYLENHAQMSVVGGAQFNGLTDIWDTINNRHVQPLQISSSVDSRESVAAPTTGSILSKSQARRLYTIITRRYL